MPRLLEPRSTVAIILGAHDWTKSGLPSAPSFRRSAHYFHQYLITRPPGGLGLEPDLIVNLFNDPSPASTQLARVRDDIRSFVREGKQNDNPIRDVLIYYLGHGSCEGGGALHFLIRDTSEGIEEQSSIAAPDLAQVLRVAAPQQRRLVILDCCFSEAAVQAFGAMGSLDEAVATTAIRDLEPGIPPPERGTLLLCSSPRTRASIGIPNAERTIFTGALLDVLRDGSMQRSEMLSFSDLRDDVYTRMLRDYDKIPPRPALHQPDQQEGDLTRWAAFPNSAWVTRQAGEEQRLRRQARSASRRKARGQERQAAEARNAEEERQAAEARRRVEKEEQAAAARRQADAEARKAEEEREAAEARRRVEKEEQAAAARRQADAEARRKAEEEREAAEARRRVEKEAQAAAARRQAQAREAAEARREVVAVERTAKTIRRKAEVRREPQPESASSYTAFAQRIDLIVVVLLLILLALPFIAPQIERAFMPAPTAANDMGLSPAGLGVPKDERNTKQK